MRTIRRPAMKLTKYAHACVALEKDGTTIVLDPGTFTPEAKDAVARAAAVLITHEHVDHFDEALLAAALEAQPQLQVFGPAAVLEKLVHRRRIRRRRLRGPACGDPLRPAGRRQCRLPDRRRGLPPR
jgi:L-ascorbate metabolism protein UlaG (beta-lactamase superfamily)